MQYFVSRCPWRMVVMGTFLHTNYHILKTISACSFKNINLNSKTSWEFWEFLWLLKIFILNTEQVKNFCLYSGSFIFCLDHTFFSCRKWILIILTGSISLHCLSWSLKYQFQLKIKFYPGNTPFFLSLKFTVNNAIKKLISLIMFLYHWACSGNTEYFLFSMY